MNSQMLYRKRLLKQLPHRLQILLAMHAHRFARVLLKRSLATRHRRQPNRTVPGEIIHQHLLVIPTQTNHSLRILAAKLQNVLDASRRIGAAVDQVAEKDQRIVCRIARQHVEQVEELRAPAMYVTNDKRSHAVWSPAVTL